MNFDDLIPGARHDEPIMPRMFIRAFDGPWHVAETKELRGDKTGAVMAHYVVPRCTHHTIGGAWGHATWKHSDAPRNICKRCLAAIAKAEGK